MKRNYFYSFILNFHLNIYFFLSQFFLLFLLENYFVSNFRILLLSYLQINFQLSLPLHLEIKIIFNLSENLMSTYGYFININEKKLFYFLDRAFNLVVCFIQNCWLTACSPRWLALA